MESRHRFLAFVATSPLLAGASHSGTARAQAPSHLPDPKVWAPRDLDCLITDPRQALDVVDFEPVMHYIVRPAHFGYMATGVDDELTLRANRDGFQKLQLLPHPLVPALSVGPRRLRPAGC